MAPESEASKDALLQAYEIAHDEGYELGWETGYKYGKEDGASASKIQTAAGTDSINIGSKPQCTPPTEVFLSDYEARSAALSWAIAALGKSTNSADFVLSQAEKYFAWLTAKGTPFTYFR